MIKHCLYLFVTILIITSCKSSKVIVDTDGVKKTYTSKGLIKKYTSARFNKETINSKWSVNFKNSKEDRNFSLKVRIKKDEVIWLKGSKIMSLFKAEITPNSVRYYSSYNKDYFEGDFSVLKKVLGVDINFNQLQSMLLGETLFGISKAKHLSKLSKNKEVQLYPKEQNPLFDVFYNINLAHFKLNKQTLNHTIKNQELTVIYPNYIKKEHTIFPKNIVIIAKENQKSTTISLKNKAVEFNTKLNTTFKIPSGYKKLTF